MQLRLSVNIYTLVPQFLEVKLVKEDPSSEARGVAAPPSRGRGLTSRPRARASDRSVSVWRWTEEARRSRWLAAGLQLGTRAASTVLLLFLMSSCLC